MRKLLLLLFVMVLLQPALKIYGQTAASYGYTVLSGTYTNIAATGTIVANPPPGYALGTLVSGIDITVQNIPIGFAFNFCGINYTQLSASNHCLISLANSGAATYTNISGNIPGPGFLMAFWDDMNGSGTHAYYQTTGIAPNRIFTIQFSDMRGNVFPWTSGTGSGSMQIKLYENNNVIEYWYGPGTLAGLTATIGIANSTADYKTVNPGFATATGGSFYTMHASPPVNGVVLRWALCPVTASASNSGPVCPGGNVTLNGITTGTSYSWAGPSGFTSTLLNPVLGGITASMAGTYTLTATDGACTLQATTTVTLSTTPPVITGITTICVGGGTTLSNATPGGTWSSSNAAIATVGTSGNVNGITGGTAIITYSTNSSCFRTVTVTVVSVAPIVGASVFCPLETTTLSCSTPGGTWSSSNSSVASVGGAGVVTGNAAGTATISYIVSGCYATTIVTVTTVVPPITGAFTLCAGSATTLSTTAGSGAWISGNPSVATINMSTGVVTGIAPGTALITYSGICGDATAVVTVNAAPAAITGNLNICGGFTTTLSNPTPGGTWSSGTPGVAALLE